MVFGFGHATFIAGTIVMILFVAKGYRRKLTHAVMHIHHHTTGNSEVEKSHRCYK
jgi:hypothetical protein